ncbi:MAG: type II toxin-antitoxin system Phd/YefM family antitoxin [Acidimicrobiales bacterium]
MRELRQNASKYLARVKKGETIEVTEHGRPVARLAPVIEDRWEAMIAAGEVTEAEPGWDDLPPPLEQAPGMSASERLEQMRADERW